MPVGSFESLESSIGSTAAADQSTGVPIRHVVGWLVAGSIGWAALILAASTTINVLH